MSRIVTGTAETDYRQCFRERLKRGGQFEAFQKARHELLDSEGYEGAWPGTFLKIAPQFGFESREDEIDRFQEYRLFGARTQMQTEVKQMRDEIRQDRKDEEIRDTLESLPVDTEIQLPADIAWVYRHPAMLREEEDGEVRLRDSDFSGAPNQGSCGMLRHYVNNKDKFYSTVLSHLSKKDVKTAGEETLGDDLRGAAEIRQMLNQL